MRSRSPRRVLILTCLLVAAMASAPSTARAQYGEYEEEPAAAASPWTGWGAMLCTVVYSPIKIAYAASGLVVGGMAWMWSFGSSRVTRPIFTAALRGDYVVAPEHLTGERRLEFIGRY
jgi:hypothetical protein